MRNKNASAVNDAAHRIAAAMVLILGDEPDYSDAAQTLISASRDLLEASEIAEASEDDDSGMPFAMSRLSEGAVVLADGIEWWQRSIAENSPEGIPMEEGPIEPPDSLVDDPACRGK